jgi:hypothetical protein
VLAEPARGREDREVLPDQGRYEERYWLTFPVARGAAISLVALIPAIFSHQPLPWLILAAIGLVLATVPWVLAVASRKVALARRHCWHHAGPGPAELAVPARLGRVRALVRSRGNRLVPRRRAVRLAHAGRPLRRDPAPPGCPGLAPRQ